MIYTNEELALWIYDRLSVGKDEEVGSMDNEKMYNAEVVIAVSEEISDGNKVCDVYVDNGLTYSNSFATNASFETILMDIEKNDVETLTMQN